MRDDEVGGEAILSWNDAGKWYEGGCRRKKEKRTAARKKNDKISCRGYAGNLIQSTN